ncbi:MAG: hypothetical protein QGF53_06780 [Alphaproteobacteria bacterium]|nr:hypothetical protein [Alphaproteobacteria bacterium]
MLETDRRVIQPCRDQNGFEQSRWRWRAGRLLSLAGLFMLSPALPAFAYIDPGTGSILLQLLIGGIAGGLYLLKVYYRNIVEKVRAMSRKKPVRQPSDEQ